MRKKLFVSLVLPAKNGCNLHCKGCCIDQKGEAGTILTHEDYKIFLFDLLSHFDVASVALQGHEILLDDTWPLTEELLQLISRILDSGRMSKPRQGTSAVTNGIFLRRYAKRLHPLLTNLTVSIDSADAKYHDRFRGMQGALAETLAGVRTATYFFGVNRLAIASILMPHNGVEILEGMPELCKHLDVKYWVVSPFFSVKKGGYVSSPEYIRASVLQLQKICQRYGVTLILSDEAGKLPLRTRDLDGAYINRIAEDSALVRLSANGRCARLDQAMLRTDAVPRWDENLPSNRLVRRMFEEIGYTL